MRRGAPLIGIDLADPRELKRRLERRPQLLSELFRAGEIAYAKSRQAPYEHLAARFCAKEAVVKALGLDGFDPLDVEIVGGGESLEFKLHGAAARRADTLGVEVTGSLTHIPTMAAAVALARPRADS